MKTQLYGVSRIATHLWRTEGPIGGIRYRATILGICLLAAPAWAESTLSLDEAVKKTLEKNPSLQVFAFRQDAIAGERFTAALRPGFEFGVEAEDFAGTGSSQGFDSTEFTVSLSSIVELGGKRQARIATVDARNELILAEQQAKALDLIGRVTLQFIETLEVQERLSLAQETVALVHETLDAVRARVDAGATPYADLLRAEAAHSQAEIAVAQLERQFEAGRVALTTLWGETSVDFAQLDGDLFQFDPVVAFETLYSKAQNNPTILTFASEDRLRKAELHLARTKARSNVRWSVGVRRLQEPRDTGLVASVSIPLFASKRSSGDIRSALAAQSEVRVRRQEAMLHLYSQLYVAYQDRKQSVEAAKALKKDSIPALVQAVADTQKAYEQGRYGYLELIGAQQELLNAKNKFIDAASAALQAGVVIEQLAAEPLSIPSTSSTGKSTFKNGEFNQ